MNYDTTICRVYSAACVGLEVVKITVEVSVAPGIGIHMVGLPDVAVKESLLRVSTALLKCGYRIPGRKIVINLAPAGLRKEGARFDAAIAAAILMASGQVTFPDSDRFLILGELALDGSFRDITAALPIAVKAAGDGFTHLICPPASVAEASCVEGIKVIGVSTLEQMVNVMKGEPIQRFSIPHPRNKKEEKYTTDFSQIRGQAFAKRGMEIAAAGGHNILLVGPPGSGKSMLAGALPSILPPMSREEALETSKIYSVAGLSDPSEGLMTRRPFRAPHQSLSTAAMVGGGVSAMPGEISLAHNGVLYLDELPQFQTSLLDLLRQPMEECRVSIARVKYRVVYPASFMLVASMNPCPCGYAGSDDLRCSCTPGMIARYQSRISGPFMDRMDLSIMVKRVESSLLVDGEHSEPSEAVRQRVTRAREVQARRFRGSGIYTNSRMDSSMCEEICVPDSQGKDFLKRLIDRYSLSARGYQRILRVSRTIADLEGAEQIGSAHIAEAAQFRFRF